MFFKKKKREIPAMPFEEKPIGLKDIIAPSSIFLASNYLRLGERLAKSYFIFSYPRYLSTAWFSPVINLDASMDVSFFIHPTDTGQVLSQLRKKVTEIQAEIMEREERGLVRDPTLEIAYRDIEDLRDRLQTAQERMFKFGIYLTVYGDEDSELREIETSLRSILEARLVYIKPALYQQRDGFLSSSPLGLDQLLIHTTMNTAPLSSAFPFVSYDLSSNEGILYGINRHNNSLILFDRFSLENANSVVFGKAGSGKTLDYHSPVLIKKKGVIQLVKIGALVEKLIKQYGTVPIDKEIEGVINPQGIEVYSFDKNLKGEWSRVTVAMRKKPPEVFYRFITRSGRSIVTTADHNMVILKDGKIITTRGEEVKQGDHIPLPRIISETKNSSRDINLLKLLKNSDKIYIQGAANLIIENYKKLKLAGISNRSNGYLKTYRKGGAISIKLFGKILKRLNIQPDEPKLFNLQITHKNRKGGIPIYFPITGDLLRLAGYITSEGTVGDDRITISNLEKEVREDIKFTLIKLKIPFRFTNREIQINSRVFSEIIKAIGGGGNSREKKVIPLVFNVDKEKIAQYLSAYFEGDGGIENNNSITVTSKSKRLISEISYLLYYFGIIGRISTTKKEATNCNWKRKRTYWIIKISGQDNLRKFAENINFISKRKRKQLSEIIQKEGNTNVDIIPGLESIFQEIHRLFDPQLYGIPEISEWKRGVRHPSPQHLLKVINKIEQRIQRFRDLASTFKTLSELPELATIIDLGKNKKKLNKALWQVLGQSWRVVKNEGVKPFCHNAFKMMEIVNGGFYSLKEVKQLIHSGFKEMDLPIKYYSRSLQSALVARPGSNTSYETIQKAAWFVWQNYQDALTNKIPQLEERLAQLKILANSDLFWDPIVEIKKIENKNEKYVYDLTVDNEVFLAGHGGMFVHNSYAIKLEILRLLMTGVEVIVIDPENEYKALTEAVGGAFFNISLASPNHINPFDLPLPREDEKPEDVLRSNIINLVGLMRVMLGGLALEEDAIIDQALTETYAAKDITPKTDPKTWPERIPLMEDFEAVLSGMEGTESLINRVRRYTRGTFAQFFNQPTNISMDKPLVVFGIRDMEDELRPIAMFIIMRYVWTAIRAELKKRILVIDEAWWIMRTEDGASFLFGTCKRARKYWLGVTTVTQDVNDFMKSTYGTPIITNSSLQLLMKQSPATIDVVKNTFNLTEEEKYLLLESPVGEGLFFAGQKHVATRVVASYIEDQFITTSPEEVIKIKKAKEELAR